MKIPLYLLALFATLAITFASGPSAPWQDKDCQDWTDKDARLIMSDSPWAKPVPMPAGGRPSITVVEPGAPEAGSPTASMGNPANSTTGNNMAVSANPGSAGPADSNSHGVSTIQTPSGMAPPAGAPNPQPGLTVIWASAAPIRLAVLRLRTKQAVTREQIDSAMKPRENYTIAVAGFPDPDPDVDPKALAGNAYLTIRGKPAVKAADSDFRRIGNSNVYFFRFPRSMAPISLADGEVDFRATVGRFEIKRKFKLGTMQYRSELAL